MIKKKVVYCEMTFLQEFLNSCPLLCINDESMRLLDAWMSFYNFICKADLVLDVSVSEFKSLTTSNEWLFKLWKKSTDNQCGLDFKKDGFPDVSSLSSEVSGTVLNAVFLTTKEEEICEKKSKDLGIFVFNTEMAKRCNHLFCDSGTAFPNDNAKDWSFIRGLTGSNVKPPISVSNSMLIIDNYVLCDDKDVDYQRKFEYNLKPILQNILPERLANGLSYDITFFVNARNEGSHIYDTHYKFLEKEIRRIRRELKFRLSIFIGKDSDKFHDRSIVTNNFMINSGYGFGILRSGGKTNSPTSINIVFPFFQTKIAWCDDSYLNIMQTAKKITERLHEPYVNCWGEHQEENRLISFYNPPKRNTNNTVQMTIFDVGEEQLHRNGRMIGKVDLSMIQDNKPRRFRR